MKNAKSMLAFVLALAMVAVVFAPASGASNISIQLNPTTNSANVTAYVNSTLTVEVNNTTSGFFLIDGLNLLLSKPVNHTNSFANNTPVFSYVQKAIRTKLSSANLSNLSISVSRSGEKLNNYTFVLHHSVHIMMNVTGIFNNSTADMAWRSFIVNNDINVSGQSATYVSVNKTYGPNNQSVLNFSAFQTSLKTWKTTYDKSTNTTTFQYDAGKTINVYANLSLPKTLIRAHLVTDPTFTIVTPGKAVATDNGIVVNYVPPTTNNPSGGKFVMIVVIIIGVALVAFYARRRR